MPGPVPGDSDSDLGRWNFEQVPQVTVHRALELTGLHCPGDNLFEALPSLCSLSFGR